MEDQAEYITEALDLLHGEPAAIIEQPQVRKVLRAGIGEEWTVAWVKLSTAFKPHIKEIRGAPLAVWLYISLSINKNGVAFPSINKIAEDTGYSRNGVMDAIKTLEDKGYLTVKRGTRRYNLYEPEFAAIGRSNEPSNESTKWTGPVGEADESTFSANRSSGVDLNKRNQKEPDSVLSEKDYQQVNAKVDAMIGNSSLEDWQGRNTFRADHYPLVDWYHRVTGQDCPKSKRKDWHAAILMWTSNGLTVDDLQAAYDMDIKWRGVFTSPNQLTDKAIALRAQKIAKPEQKEFTRLL